MKNIKKYYFQQDSKYLTELIFLKTSYSFLKGTVNVFSSNFSWKDGNAQIDSSTIDGNVKCVHSQYSCIMTSQVSTQFVCQTKLLIIMIIILE